MRFITVCRDNRWVKIPYVLLVKGDLIYTNFLERDVEFYGIKYKKADGHGSLISHSITTAYLSLIN